MRETVSGTRRAVLKAVAGALGIGAVGTASGHPASGSHDIHEHNVTKNAERVGYHSLGGEGSESLSGRPEDALHGVVSEVWVEGDLAFVSMLSTSEPHGNRGVAIVDVSGYTRADSVPEMRETEMAVISFIGNETEAGTAADVKVSDDGRYLVYSKQAIGATYGEPASTSTEDQDGMGPDPLGIEAYDISDPGNPQYLGSAQGPNAGFHNCFVHRIGGEVYVFGVQGVAPGDAGVHVYRLHEDGGLEPVNFWSGGDLRQGEYHTDATGYLAAGYYSHDFYAHDDPKTGRPVGYWAFFDGGVRVLDLSDPTDVEPLGIGDMSRAHYAQPAPATIDGKRVFVGGQEWSERADTFSGKVVLFDGDALFEDGVTRCPVLDSWTLYEDVSYEGFVFSPHNADITTDGWITQAHYHAGIRFLKIQPPAESSTGEWRLAGKRIDRDDTDDRERIPTDHAETFAGTSGVDATGNANNYRHHEFTSPLDEVGIVDGTLTWSPEASELDLYLQENVSGDPEDPEWQTVAAQESPIGQPKTVSSPVDPETRYRFRVETDYVVPGSYSIEAAFFDLGPLPPEEEPDVEEEGLAYYRDHVEVPEESRTEGDVAPNFWSARHENGVTFGGDINTGLYAIVADPVDVGTRTPADVDVTRIDAADVYTAGQTVRGELVVDTDTEVLVRDRVPRAWKVYDQDARDVGDGTNVRLGAVDGRERLRYFAEVRGDTGGQVVGPVEFSTDGGTTWEPVPGTTDTNLNTGFSQ